MNHDVDHIHLHLSIPPKMKVSDVVRTMKSISNRLLKEKFEYMRKTYGGIDGIWSDGYFMSTIGINENVIRQYIERQGKRSLYSTFRSTVIPRPRLRQGFIQCRQAWCRDLCDSIRVIV